MCNRELEMWKRLRYQRARRVWKASWGNFLGAEHLRLLGGSEGMLQADPQRCSLAESMEQAYQQGVERLCNCGCCEQWHELARGGVLLTLSPSPLDWGDPQVQARRTRLQEALGRLAIGPWDSETVSKPGSVVQLCLAITTYVSRDSF